MIQQTFKIPMRKCFTARGGERKVQKKTLGIATGIVDQYEDVTFAIFRLIQKAGLAI